MSQTTLKDVVEDTQKRMETRIGFIRKREWDRNRSFVRIRFRRPTSAQLSRAVKLMKSA